MTASDLSYDRYATDGHEEWRLRIGAADAPALLFLPPLFEELNRTRAIIVAAMRALAARGWHCLLPDLPGTGESERPLEACSWQDWRNAAKAAAPGRELAGIVSIRGGCLLDAEAGARGVWRLSPVDGAALLRDLERSGLVGEGARAGYAPAPALTAGLTTAVPASSERLRVVRLASDPAPADLKLDAPPLWRRAEPQSSAELAALIAGDVDQWVRTCAA